MSDQSEAGILLTTLSAALILTVVIEGAVTLILTRSKRFLLFNYWCNCLTNPLLNLALWFIRRETGDSAYWAVAIGEIMVLLSEYLLYYIIDGKKLPRRKYFRLSLITNGASFGIGEILNFMFFR